MSLQVDIAFEEMKIELWSCDKIIKFMKVFEFMSMRSF